MHFSEKICAYPNELSPITLYLINIQLLCLSPNADSEIMKLYPRVSGLNHNEINKLNNNNNNNNKTTNTR